MATTWLVCVVCTPATLALARPARLLCTPRPMRLAGVCCAAGRSAVPAAFSDALTTLRVAIHLIRVVLPPTLSARRHHATHGLPRKARVLLAETLWDLAEKLDRHRIITSLIQQHVSRVPQDTVNPFMSAAPTGTPRNLHGALALVGVEGATNKRGACRRCRHVVQRGAQAGTIGSCCGKEATADVTQPAGEESHCQGIQVEHR